MRAVTLLLAVVAMPGWAQHAQTMTHAPVVSTASAASNDAPPSHDDGATASHDSAAHDHAGMAMTDMSADEARPQDDAPAASPHHMHDHGAMDMPDAAYNAPTAPIAPLTDADRAAAFPAVARHDMHDRTRQGFLRIDRLERGDDDTLGGELTAWSGGDTHRIWLRAQAEGANARLHDGDVEVLAGRLVAPWWDVVAGVRQDIGDGPSRTWAAFGVQGLAPYKFDVRATVYFGRAGRTAARVETEYDTLLSRRVALQWRAEANAYGQSDPARGPGSGLATLEAGGRLRYEITRRIAPYLGIERERAFGGTAKQRADDADATRVVAGLRLVF